MKISKKHIKCALDWALNIAVAALAIFTGASVYFAFAFLGVL